jgi:hypothetical protein
LVPRPNSTIVNLLHRTSSSWTRHHPFQEKRKTHKPQATKITINPGTIAAPSHLVASPPSLYDCRALSFNALEVRQMLPPWQTQILNCSGSWTSCSGNSRYVLSLLEPGRCLHISVSASSAFALMPGCNGTLIACVEYTNYLLAGISASLILLFPCTTSGESRARPFYPA